METAVVIEPDDAQVVKDMDRWGMSAKTDYDHAACPGCATICTGVFESRPGNWGTRRLAVKLRSGGMELS